LSTTARLALSIGLFVKALHPRFLIGQPRKNQKGGSEMVAIFVVLTIVAFILVDAAVQRRQIHH
jgi:uncharacterized membrane protein